MVQISFGSCCRERFDLGLFDSVPALSGKGVALVWRRTGQSQMRPLPLRRSRRRRPPSKRNKKRVGRAPLCGSKLKPFLPPPPSPSPLGGTSAFCISLAVFLFFRTRVPALKMAVGAVAVVRADSDRVSGKKSRAPSTCGQIAALSLYV